MDRQKALAMAQEEIELCKRTNNFSNHDIWDVYTSVPESIISDEPLIRELFADYFMIYASPLAEAMREEDV